MHRLTWSGIALHEGHLPGFAASHGCIRMPHRFRFAALEREQARHAGRGGALDVTPQDITHAKLFNPAPKPVDNSPRRAKSSKGSRSPRRRSDRAGPRASALIQVAEAPIAPENAPARHRRARRRRVVAAAGRAPIRGKASASRCLPHRAIGSCRHAAQRTAAPATERRRRCGLRRRRRQCLRQLRSIQLPPLQ